jgi:protoporphyrinogen oxidase
MATENPGQHWGIIGGGIMGMTLALRLADMGMQVTILESSPAPGGLAGAVERNGITWDRFYHVILLSDLHTRSILSDIGLTGELVWAETRTGFYLENRLYSMSNIMEYLRFPPIGLAGKLRLGVTIALASLIRDWKRMEGIPVEKWLRRWSGNQVFSKIWLPLLKAKLGEHYNNTSANFIWATIQRMYAARRSGLKKEMFGYVRGGYDRIIRSFTETLTEKSVQIRTGTTVEEIRREKGNKLSVRTESREQFTFDRVISTLPSPLSASLAPDLRKDEIEQLRAIRYLGVICPSLLLKRPVSAYYITNIIDPWTPFTGIIEMTALIDPSEVGGLHLVYLPKYVSPDDPLHRKSEEELKEYFLGGLFRMYPGLSGDDVLHWSLASARQVFALPTLHYSEKLPPVATSVEGYYIVNTAHIISGTLNVNETIRVADSKLEEIVRNHGS